MPEASILLPGKMDQNQSQNSPLSHWSSYQLARRQRPNPAQMRVHQSIFSTLETNGMLHKDGLFLRIEMKTGTWQVLFKYIHKEANGVNDGNILGVACDQI